MPKLVVAPRETTATNEVFFTVLGFLRLATVCVLMFGGGVLAADIAATPLSVHLPLFGTTCAGDHCGPTPFTPRMVADLDEVKAPPCAALALHGPVSKQAAPRPLPSSLSVSSNPTATPLDAEIARANKSEIVSIAGTAGSSVDAVVLFQCLSSGLTEQIVRFSKATNTQLTLETIRSR